MRSFTAKRPPDENQWWDLGGLLEGSFLEPTPQTFKELEMQMDGMVFKVTSKVGIS